MAAPGILVFRWVQVAKPVRTHAKLLAVGMSDDIAVVYVGNADFHATLADAIKEEVGPDPLVGAANINKRGEVTSWESSGFKFETPEDLREPIAHLIQEHAREIEDGWAV